MRKGPIFRFVAVDCAPGLEGKFNKWVDEVHIPLLLRFSKLKSISRYQLAGPVENWPRYLGTYEFEDMQAVKEYLISSEFKAAEEEMKQTWKVGGIQVKWQAHYEFLTSFEGASED